ncbi:type III secretion system outer membrane ring subunit SctC [Serratia quinivorans]|uniref:type III secretion system outer membrane ring subunit SctC n=1 Tax=Serratia quinivorans TaxID=137545 RepID=UPI003981BF3A
MKLLVMVIKSLACGCMILMLLPGMSCAQMQEQGASGYISRQDSIKGLMDALSSRVNKPIILSKLVSAKKISGDFDLQNPQKFIEDIARQLGIIWYHDGQAIYLYDVSEMRNEIVTLRNTSFSAVRDFLKKSGLYDKRYPLRSDNVSSTFYLSGPPVYVGLVVKVANFLDEKSNELDGRSKVAAIPLLNTFVDDRHLSYRDEKITIPGVANVVRQLLNDADAGGDIVLPERTTLADQSDAASATGKLPAFPEHRKALPFVPKMSLASALQERSGGSGFKVVANPGSNSLLVKGSAEQISYVRKIISALDQAKRHIELSVWIVDLQKDVLDQLGAEWSGSVNLGDSLGFSINGGRGSTVDGTRFMASILALTQKKQANIVSRPMVLTQENTPAIFDNSRTFYTQLLGERSVELQHVTYGTSINVLPRFTEDDDIEMMLNVEDGSQLLRDEDNSNELPEVGRTNISTIARVPRGKSLLIGGYTRDENTQGEAKIPGLGDLPLVGGAFKYHKSRNSTMVRVFLIQPREIDAPLARDASDLMAEMRSHLSNPELHDWMHNYMDSQKWH